MLDPVRTCALLAGFTLSAAMFAGCGGGSDAPPRGATPAIEPSGVSAQAVAYRCSSGRRDTISVSLPDPRRLAEVLNPINVCEYDGGLAEVTLDVSCADGASDVPVRIAAVDGELPPSTAEAVCR